MHAGDILPANDEQYADKAAERNPAPLYEAAIVDIVGIEAERGKNQQPDRCDDGEANDIFMKIDIVQQRAQVYLGAYIVGNAKHGGEHHQIGGHKE